MAAIESAVMGEDVGVNGGVFRVTKGFSKSTAPARARHAARRVRHHRHGGRHGHLRPQPVAEIQFSGFTVQAFDQIEQNMARYRNRSRGRYPITWCCAPPTAAASAPSSITPSRAKPTGPTRPG